MWSISSRELDRDFREASRLLNNAHLLPGRLTASAAWQDSLLIRRDATLRISGALHLDIFEQPEK